MIETIPTIVAGGVVKKFSDSFLGKPSVTLGGQKRSPRIRRAKKAGRKLSKYSPF